MATVKIFYLFLCFLSAVLNLNAELFSYDKAICALQQGNYEKALDRFKVLLPRDAHNPSLVYDAGIASYKTNQFSQAKAYFNQVAHMANAPALLQEKAYFNLANTAVELKELPQAIKAYENVLALNEKNEPARYNLNKVKEMLKQQEKQKQEQDNKQNKSQKDKDKSQSNDSNKKDEQKQKDDEQQKDSKEQKTDNKKETQNKSDGQKNEQQKPDKQKGQDSDNSDKKENSQNPHNEPEEQKQGAQNSSQKSKQEQEEKDNQAHEMSPTNSKHSKNKENALDEQEGLGKENEKNGQRKKIDAWLGSILDAQEKKDAAMNKKLIRASVNKKLAGQHGQNCW